MRYFFETEYLVDRHFPAQRIVNKIASYFSATSDRFAIEGTTKDKSETFNYEGLLTTSNRAKLNKILAQADYITKLVFINKGQKDEAAHCAMYDSPHNWTLQLNKKEYKAFTKWLHHNRLPTDLFFPEDQMIVQPLNNPLDKVLRAFGFISETTRSYTPLAWKRKVRETLS